MKKTSTTIVAFLLLATLATGCGNQTPQPPSETAAPHDHAKHQVIPYPLDHCLVSGEKLGSMGDPHVITHQGHEVKFCCKDCVKEFEADTRKFMAKLTEAK